MEDEFWRFEEWEDQDKFEIYHLLDQNGNLYQFTRSWEILSLYEDTQDDIDFSQSKVYTETWVRCADITELCYDIVEETEEVPYHDWKRGKLNEVADKFGWPRIEQQGGTL